MVNVEAIPTEVGAQDVLVLHISGVKAGSGRKMPDTIVNETVKLAVFLDTWGTGSGGGPKYDHDKLAVLAATDKVQFEAAMAELMDSLAGGSVALPEQIIDATCKYLVEEHGLVVADDDPGNDVWYISKGDLQPTVRQYQGDGYMWSIIETAPFG